MILAFLVGALTVGTTDRLPVIGPLATWFDDVLMYLVRGSISLVLYAFGAGFVGIWIDHSLESLGLYRWPRKAA
jgi:hypothetical protein